ncbi:MAG: hypothetical protein KAJ19_13705, partial [Gammaproteobacteria bacterium]|nr:hypothetical protein [Gammaproteobacteria bacterium]
LNNTKDVETFMLSFSKDEIPKIYFLYSEGFISNNNTYWTHNLKNIVKTKNGDCGDISLGAYNLFKKAGIDARVVKVYRKHGTLYIKEHAGSENLINVDVHIICVYKTKSGIGFIDHKQIKETNYQSVFELFCKREKFQEYAIRARFVNEEKWNLCIPEQKEIEDGPLTDRRTFYNKNFFYVKDRDENYCDKLKEPELK